MAYFPLEPASSDGLLFHYTGASSLAGILDSGVLRASALSRMNDPRESKEFQFGSAIADEIANSVLRAGVRILSFTVEDADLGDSNHWGRGFCRARNWAQYGEAHQGAVLVFDRDELVKQCEGVEGVRQVHHGPVIYSDRQVQDADDGWLNFAPDDLDSEEHTRLRAESWIDQHWGHLYFEKARDWASEQEYRIVMFGMEPFQASADLPIEVPIASSLRGVVLGELFPQREANVLATRLRRLDIPYLGVRKMIWESGHPGVMNLANDLPGIYPAGRWSDQVVARYDSEPAPAEKDWIRTCETDGVRMEQVDATKWTCPNCSRVMDGFV